MRFGTRLGMRETSIGETVRAVAANDQEKPRSISIVKRSGHRTIHMYVPEDGQGRKDEVLAELKRLGASHEHANGKFYALDFQPNVDVTPTITYLQSLEPDKLIDLRVSDSN